LTRFVTNGIIVTMRDNTEAEFMFRKLRGVKLSYEQQGFVRFCCLTYNDQPQEVKDKILNLAIRHGKEKWQALFELMTTRKTAVNISAVHFTSEMTLYRMRVKFYHGWFDEGQSLPKKLPEIC